MQVCLVRWVGQSEAHTDKDPSSGPLTIFRHVTLLLSVFRYSLSCIFFNYYSSAAQIAYRLTFISAAVTYGIVVYKGHFARGVQGSPLAIVLKLISDENVQYLGK